MSDQSTWQNGSTAVAETVDATRRTNLANERTLLAWWRSALAALAVAIGAGAVLPHISRNPQSTRLLGVAFATYAGVLFVVGTRRQRSVDRALREGRFEPPNGALMLWLGIAGVLLAIATVVVISVSGAVE